MSFLRYFAICRPLQYKPSASFYTLFVFGTSLSVNVGRFLEFRSHRYDSGLKGRLEQQYFQTDWNLTTVSIHFRTLWK